MRDLSGKNPVHIRLTPIGLLALLIVVGLLGWGVLSISGWINVPQGNFVVLIQKTGKDLPSKKHYRSRQQYKKEEQHAIAVYRLYYFFGFKVVHKILI